MNNFDLKKYLTEGRLFKENKMLDIYQDGDVVIDISTATPEQERLIRWETEISDFDNSEEAQEIANDIMQLNSEDEVEDYYANERGWEGDSDFSRMIRVAMDVYRGNLSESMDSTTENYLENNLEKAISYYLYKQLEDILKTNQNISNVSENLKDVIDISNNVSNLKEFYNMVENFGWEIKDIDINTIKQFGY